MKNFTNHPGFKANKILHRDFIKKTVYKWKLVLSDRYRQYNHECHNSSLFFQCATWGNDFKYANKNGSRHEVDLHPKQPFEYVSLPNTKHIFYFLWNYSFVLFDVGQSKMRYLKRSFSKCGHLTGYHFVFFNERYLNLQTITFKKFFKTRQFLGLVHLRAPGEIIVVKLTV